MFQELDYFRNTLFSFFFKSFSLSTFVKYLVFLKKKKKKKIYKASIRICQNKSIF